MASTRVDPITLEVVKNALASVADEMALVVMRSAYSPVVRDTMDYSTALCDRDGRVLAQGLTLAVQLGSFPIVMRHVLEHFGDDVREGDVFVTNDPYGFGGQHLPDIYVIQPIFHEGRLEGYAATMAHHVDVGGLTPGSIAIHATEIFQEGLRIPLLKLYDAGAENTTAFQILAKNTRQPVSVIGDLRAQVAACRAGQRGLVEILERHGAETTRACAGELQRLSERLMRAEIGALPDGVYAFEDYIDGVGEKPEPLRIAVSVRIDGEEAWVDFEGTSPQIAAGLNCPVGLIHAATFCAFRGIATRDIPNAEGYMWPIHIHAPSGTIVNPVLPAACGARGVVGYRTYEALMGALAQIVPDRVVAPGDGGPTLIAIGGYEDGSPFVLAEVLVGCWGARATRDGLEGVSNPLANLSNQPIELLERELPLRVLGYGLVPDSGGPGRNRGGLAYVRSYELLADEAVLTVRSDRRYHRPYGLDGGLHGGASGNEIRSGDVRRDVPPMPMEALALRSGDVFQHTSPGGGGVGDPFARDAAAVLDDVLDGKVTVASAREHYGVVIVGDAVDEAATAAVRGGRASPA